MTSFVRFGLAAALAGVSAPASAQIYEIVGTRAQGMGGAFVAVADDATATWWNPAGIATGPNANFLYDRVRTVDPEEPELARPAWLGRTSAYAFAYPAMGLSLYRLRVSEIRPVSPTETAEPGRQDPGTPGVDTVELRTVALSQYGVSVVQSLGTGLFIGSTLKIVRGGGLATTDTGSEDAIERLERAGDADVSSDTHTDLDIGVLAAFGRVRAGAAVKNVRQPEFGEGDSAIALKRHARAGIAVVGLTSSALSLTAAVDADLTRTATAVGEARHVAAGAEALFFERRVGLRGGLSANTVGAGGHSMSLGLSLGSSGGSYVDGALTFGSDKTRKGWGLSLRLSF